MLYVVGVISIVNVSSEITVEGANSFVTFVWSSSIILSATTNGYSPPFKSFRSRTVTCEGVREPSADFLGWLATPFTLRYQIHV